MQNQLLGYLLIVFGRRHFLYNRRTRTLRDMSEQQNTQVWNAEVLTRDPGITALLSEPCSTAVTLCTEIEAQLPSESLEF
jgi:hypothetical protein